MALIDRELGRDLEVWNDPELWTTLMGKMRDTDEKMYYSSARTGSIRKNFSEMFLSEYMSQSKFGEGKVFTYRPDMKKIPEEITINGINFQKWEILTLIRSGNPHLWTE